MQTMMTGKENDDCDFPSVAELFCSTCLYHLSSHLIISSLIISHFISHGMESHGALVTGGALVVARKMLLRPES